RELGVDPESGLMLTAKYGQYGAYVQKGEGDNRQFASLGRGQLIETITLEDALKLFALPRTVGTHEGVDIIATKGRFGPYLKYGNRNVSIPRGKDPLTITIEECVALLNENDNKPAANAPIAEFGDIQVLSGRYGPYIKYNGSNYKIPAGKDAAALTESECRAIVENGAPTGKARRTFKKK
ncbi:MAG: DNA topoisomerase I, partial [Bacteroidales bacterium]|nr:DNA topoisomerase I [Bacteroidales bacterium]